MSAESFRQNMNIGMLPAEARGIVALDDMTRADSEGMLAEIGQYFGMAKENANAQSKGWADAVRRAKQHELPLMADAKYHDTPRTMASCIETDTLDGARVITVHTSADLEALTACVETRDATRIKMRNNGRRFDPFVGSLFGITILTSINDERCRVIYGMPLKEKVMQLARLAVVAKLEGIVCAGSDLAELQSDPDTSRLVKIVPGMVLSGSPKTTGQQRTMSPREAILEGADYLVAGSTVTKAPLRLEAAQRFAQEIAEGLGH